MGPFAILVLITGAIISLAIFINKYRSLKEKNRIELEESINRVLQMLSEYDEYCEKLERKFTTEYLEKLKKEIDEGQFESVKYSLDFSIGMREFFQLQKKMFLLITPDYRNRMEKKVEILIKQSESQLPQLIKDMELLLTANTVGGVYMPIDKTFIENDL